jgi:hypothetical protein
MYKAPPFEVDLLDSKYDNSTDKLTFLILIEPPFLPVILINLELFKFKYT